MFTDERTDSQRFAAVRMPQLVVRTRHRIIRKDRFHAYRQRAIGKRAGRLRCVGVERCICEHAPEHLLGIVVLYLGITE